MRERSRACLSAAVAVSILLAAAPAALGAGGSAPEILPVWAVVDGDTPLDGARVRVLKDGRPIRQLDGRERTHSTGVSLLRFDRLPRRFTVEVTPRRKLGGRLRAVVRQHHSARVVHVSPVTTLIADLAVQRRRGRPIGLRAARREVYDALRIPDWHDHADLRHSDRYFDGDAYLRAARKADGIAALNRALARHARADRRRPFHNRGRTTARAAATNWLTLLTNPEALIAEIFKAVAKNAGSTALEMAKHKAGETALGWLLGMFGLDEPELGEEELHEIHEALDALGKQLTEVKGQIDRVTFTTLVHLNNEEIGRIDHASNQLALLANVEPTDAHRVTYANDIVEYIGKNLLDVPEILQQSLGSNVPLSENLLVMASRTVHTRGRFFDSEDSAAVASVHAYFAAYQARLSVLLAEYYHARSDIYPPSAVAANLAAIERDVTAQAAWLKPPVPRGTVMDTRTGMMWMQTIDGSSLLRPSAFAEVVGVDASHSGSLQLKPWVVESTSLPGLPFGNWAMPDANNLNVLLSDRGDRDGVEHLAQAARISKSVLEAGNAHVYIRDTFEYGPIYFLGNVDGYSLRYRLYDLRHAGVAAPTEVKFRSPGNWRAAFENAGAQAILYRRVVAPGEEYWWR